MKVLHIDTPHFDICLSPLVTTLDACWWWFGGEGVSPPKELLFADDPEALAEWCDALGSLIDDVQTWRIGRVGRPGFFSRFASGMGHDWDVYFVSDAAALPVESFHAMMGQSTNWFGRF